MLAAIINGKYREIPSIKNGIKTKKILLVIESQKPCKSFDQEGQKIKWTIIRTMQILCMTKIVSEMSIIQVIKREPNEAHRSIP